MFFLYISLIEVNLEANDAYLIMFKQIGVYAIGSFGNITDGLKEAHDFGIV